MAFTSTVLLAAAGGYAISSMASGRQKTPVIPPSPVIPQSQVDQSQQQAENDAKKRQQLSGGLASTVGTAGGEAGSILNPSTVSGKTLLGQ